MTVTISPHSAEVNRLVADVLDHFRDGGTEVDLRGRLTDAVNATANWGYKRGVADADFDYECDLPHITEAAGKSVERARDALDALHRALHDSMPVRACLDDACMTLDRALSTTEALSV